jgi:UDP-N-acetylglucosamine 4,6-dehydratase
MKILITGGSGSLGKQICSNLIEDESISEIVIFSRNEKNQFSMMQEILDKRVKYIIGDIRDNAAITNALIGVDLVYHTAAIKHIDIAEKNPQETIKTNVLGTINVINASIQNNVKKVLFISTDKTSRPTNIYGVSKLLAEKNILLSNNISQTKFSAVRFGNLIGSSGSIFKKWEKAKKEGSRIQVTDKNINRFFISLEDSANICMYFMDIMNGNEILIPKMKSANVYDIAMSIVSEDKIDIIGLRPAEKMSEDIISDSDLGTVQEFENYFILTPGNTVPLIEYNSATNDKWFSKQEIDNLFA